MRYITAPIGPSPSADSTTNQKNTPNTCRCAASSAAMSIEALLGNLKPYHATLHELRGFRGAMTCAENLRTLLAEPVGEPGGGMANAIVGTLLAYATSPGNVASDGEGAHSLYTEHLLREMKGRGERIAALTASTVSMGVARERAPTSGRRSSARCPA